MTTTQNTSSGEPDDLYAQYRRAWTHNMTQIARVLRNSVKFGGRK